MKKSLIGALAFTLASFNAVAQDAGEVRPKPSLAQIQKAEMRKKMAHLSAPIKTAADLREYQYSSSFHTGPLKALSEGGRQRFLGSLTFNEKGLSGYRYEDLQSELSISQIYQLLSLFGVQHTTPMIKSAGAANSLEQAIVTDPDYVQFADYKDYACTSRATCTRAWGAICTSNC